MKKIIPLLVLCQMMLFGCSTDEPVAVETEDEVLGTLSCMTSYEAQGLYESTVESTFEHTQDYFLDQLPTLFQDATFLDLKAKSNVATICVFGDQTAFVLYGEFDEFNNVIGLMTREGLVTQYENNYGGGDIGLCQIVGYLDGLIYQCGGGDGPGGHYKRGVLSEEGENTVLQDCTYSTENLETLVEVCETDVMGW